MDEPSINSSDSVNEGICCCCLEKGSGYKKLANCDVWNGSRIIYSDIITYTLDINILNVKSNKLICLSCILQLHQAYKFKNMILNAQNIYDTIQDESCDMKTEDIKAEPDDDYDRDYTSDDAVEISADVKVDVVSRSKDRRELLESIFQRDTTITEREKVFLKRFEHLPYKPLSKKSILPKAPAFIKKRIESSVSTTSAIGEKTAIIKNMATILNFSNATPFKSKGLNGFPCFYCRKPFKALPELQTHVRDSHKDKIMKNAVWRHGSECLVVYVDVTELKCTICDETQLNLNVLKKHLVKEHSKVVYFDCTDRIVPFKLGPDGYPCQMCESFFETFGSIERHMNTHFRNYVCIECGGGFVTNYRLKTHIRNMHMKGAYPCKQCQKNFESSQKLKNHVNSVHMMTKRFKCPQCSERFTEYFKRQKHLVDTHGANPLEYKCNVCDKVFTRRYTLSRHMKKDHLEERDYQCDICPYRCFTKSELRIHMIKHNGLRIHECKVCLKSYARKKTLKEHMRIHNDDRRFTCTVCGQAFIQKCSLKGHIKTHHPELNEIP